MASSFTPQSLWAQDHNPGTHLTGSWVNCSTVLDHAKKRSTPNCCTDYKSDYPVVQSDGSFVHKLSFSNYPLLKCSCWSAHGNYFPFPPPGLPNSRVKTDAQCCFFLLSMWRSKTKREPQDSPVEQVREVNVIVTSQRCHCTQRCQILTFIIIR